MEMTDHTVRSGAGLWAVPLEASGEDSGSIGVRVWAGPGVCEAAVPAQCDTSQYTVILSGCSEEGLRKVGCGLFARRGRRGPVWATTHSRGRALLALGDGQHAVIESILGGVQMQARLENMGLRPGKVVTRLSAMPSGGPVIVECGGTRVALGRGIAQHVLVSAADTPQPGSETDRDT